MITLRLTADVADDRRVVLTLPPEVPTGKAELVVTVESPESGSQSRPPWGVPAAQIRGIVAGNGSPPDDATVDQWIREHRSDKYE
jgi:hypothetical protein